MSNNQEQAVEIPVTDDVAIVNDESDDEYTDGEQGGDALKADFDRTLAEMLSGNFAPTPAPCTVAEFTTDLRAQVEDNLAKRKASYEAFSEHANPLIDTADKPLADAAEFALDILGQKLDAFNRADALLVAVLDALDAAAAGKPLTGEMQLAFSEIGSLVNDALKRQHDR